MSAQCSVSAFVRPLMSLPQSCYIHLPFCAQRCSYCAFPVIVSGRSALPTFESLPSPSQAHVSYVDLLCREIRATLNNLPSIPLTTLYFGGGTPSLLHPSLLSLLLDTVQTSIGLQHNAEITCEMDPATFTSQTARQYRLLGVNRASVGAQSFNDSELASCARVHRERDIHVAVRNLRDAGFENLSLDLITGLPEQTIQSWDRSLQKAVELKPEHLALYDLQLEEGTKFGREYKLGIWPLPREEESVKMLQRGMKVLRMEGYEHYEISNYARKGGRSRHNMAYWKNEEFYGFGLGATSLVGGRRFERPRGLGGYRRYVESVERGEEDGRVERSEQERLEDFLINGFRLLIEGVKLMELEREFGEKVRERVEEGVRQVEEMGEGLIEVVDGRVRLTEKGGLIENSVLAVLMYEAVWKYNEG